MASRRYHNGVVSQQWGRGRDLEHILTTKVCTVGDINIRPSSVIHMPIKKLQCVARSHSMAGYQHIPYFQDGARHSGPFQRCRHPTWGPLLVTDCTLSDTETPQTPATDRHGGAALCDVSDHRWPALRLRSGSRGFPRGSGRVLRGPAGSRGVRRSSAGSGGGPVGVR